MWDPLQVLRTCSHVVHGSVLVALPLPACTPVLPRVQRLTHPPRGVPSGGHPWEVLRCPVRPHR